MTTDAITVSDYMRKPEIIQRFSEVLGNENQANSYIQSVLILAASDDKLMACTPRSIYTAAMRAASLGLSCDPAVKQAWLVPYNRNVGTRDKPIWVKEAQFQPHYKGLYTLAMRTGKYWTINVSPVYEGQRVLENPLTGLHVVVEGNGFVGEPKSYSPAYVDVTVRRRKDLKVIGWIGYFKTKRGSEKSVWMSCIEIDDHARKYVKDYLDDRGQIKNPNWKDPDKRPTMEMKTVLRQLASWMDLSGDENKHLVEALQADTGEAIDALSEDVTPTPGEQEPQHEMTYEQAKATFNTDPPKVEQSKKSKEPVLQMYRYNDQMIVNAVKKITSFSIEESAATMHEAFKKNQIGATLTVAEAEDFARALVTPKETAQH